MRHSKDTDQSVVKSSGLGIGLQEVIDNLEDEVFIVDSGYHILFVNSAARRRLPEDTPSPLGRYCYEILEGRDRPCGAPLWDCPLRKVMETGKQTRLVHPSRTLAADTLGKYVQLTLYPLKGCDGGINALIEMRRDVSAERELEREILRRHHQLLALNRISSAVSGLQHLDAVLNVALDAVLEIVNGTIGGILLLDERTQKLRYQVQRGLSAKYVEEMQLGLGEGIAGKVAQTGEPILVRDISEDPRAARLDLVSAEGLKGFVSVPLRAKNKVVGVMNIASHMPGQFATEDMYLLDLIGYQLGTAIEQARLYERLSNATERYQRLLQYALTAQEEERKRIARELHDETSQTLTGLALNLQAIMEMTEMSDIKDARIKEGLKKTHSLAVQASLEINKLINDLRPTLLDTLGLLPAIRRYVETWLQPVGINASMQARGGERLPSEIEVALFRITQEAINNILKHSEAKNVFIDLECDAQRCVLRIEDDGKGFDVQEITKVEKTGRGVGLFSMKERVTLVGGTCSVQSQPGRGTKIIAEVPLIGSTTDAENKGVGSR